MKINNIQIKNLRSFEDIEVIFQKSNLITGWNKDTNDGNGTGKSSLVLSVLILIGGAKLTNINLTKLVRDGEKSATIKGTIEVGDDILDIERVLKKKGSGSLKVKVNGKDLECSTSKVYQEKLFEYIGSAENFKKFRIIDDSSGVNILDFTSGQLRKTLMSLCQDKFEGIRKRLLDKKNLFEKYNKSSVIYKHSPSEKRSRVLESAIKNLDTTKLNEIMKKIQSFQKEKNQLLTKKGKLSQDAYIKNQQMQKFKSMATCPTCLQKVTDEYKKPIFDDLTQKIQELTKQTNSLLTDLKMYDEIIGQEEKKRTEVYNRKQKLNNLKSKLQTRLAQKDYVYSDSDIEIAKKAIEVIDSFSNYYVVEWVKIIEPIVNSYINQLNMEMQFQPDEKGNIEVSVTRNEKTYTYDMLSQGEKIFISTVFKIALLMERQESGLIISDESFNSLSSENLNRILEVVSNLPVQLLCISHNPNIEESLAHKIDIIKENDVSTIKEG